MTSKAGPRRAIARELRPFAWPSLLLVGYWLLATAFSHVSARHGLLSPSGSLNPGVALFGVVLLAARCVAFFLLPLVASYRLASRLAAWVTRRLPPSGA